MPKALVNIVNNYAITTIINSRENPVQIDFENNFEVESIFAT